jgi:DNA-binding transcriptional LysR family regulator
MISMRALECLVAVVEQGSMTKAAAALYMSQPALSHQIAAIERELGTSVIERLSRGIRPTRAGAAAAAEARIALAAADRAVLAGKQVAAGAGGRIRISCVEMMTAWILLPVLRDWRRRFPQVELAVQEHATAELMLEAARFEETDLSTGPGLAGQDHCVEVLGQEEIVVVASAEHRLAALSAVSRAELADELLVHYGAGGLGEPAVGRRHLPGRPMLHTASPQTAAQLAAAGMGWQSSPSPPSLRSRCPAS